MAKAKTFTERTATKPPLSRPLQAEARDVVSGLVGIAGQVKVAVENHNRTTLVDNAAEFAAELRRFADVVDSFPSL